MKYFLITTLLLLTLAVGAQDCQLISMTLPIPQGVSKHHFPSQAMPLSASENFFTYLASWDQGDLVIRMRFSADRENWTKWEILKKDYTQQEATNSPLHIANNEYEFFEWAVYNKAGLESELSLNFYYPIEEPQYADIATAYETKVSTVGCPQPTLVDLNANSTIVGRTKNK